MNKMMKLKRALSTGCFVTLTSVTAQRTKIRQISTKRQIRGKNEDKEVRGALLGEIGHKLGEKVKTMTRGDKTFLFSVKIRPAVFPRK